MSVVRDSLDRFFSSSKEPILFSGAGVSSRAGVATWAGLLEKMKEWIRSRDALTTHQVDDCIRSGDYLAAADYIFMSRKVADGERLKVLSGFLSQYDASKIDNLVSLPFHAFVTTNFDRCIIDSYANLKNGTLIDIRRGDASFKETQWCSQKFLARIHGAAEFPGSIVLKTSHFESLEEDAVYKDILVNLFTHKNLLFLGCSFADPAIKSVFEYVNKLYGAAPTGLHMALVPDNVGGDFIAKLGRMNVEVVKYNPDNHHQELWDAIDGMSNGKVVPVKAVHGALSVTNFSTAKKFLASCYARLKLSSRVAPLRGAVVEGVVSSIVQSHAPKGIDVRDVFRAVHEELGISLAEAEVLVGGAITCLVEEKMCRLHNDGGVRKVAWSDASSLDSTALDDAIHSLAGFALDRAVVQEGLRQTDGMQAGLEKFFSGLIVQRGWDLGAAFAAHKVPKDADVVGLLYELCPLLSDTEVSAFSRVCSRMFMNPTDSEAAFLSELGRASFAMELVASCPRSVLFYKEILPHNVYLDANVLMPAITYGHPYHQVYRDTIDRLKEAVAASGGITRVVVYYGFLNEIVSHRRKAIQIAEDWGDGFRDGILREALFYGTSNMNVFVGAYANIAQVDKNLEFSDFLKRYSPYASENDLAKWLVDKGVIVLRENQINTLDYANVSLDLQRSYANALVSGKNIRLIEHDAKQVAVLNYDHKHGQRSVFVTADKRLREMVAQGGYNNIAEYMVTNIGLTQMVDLLAGSPTEPRALTTLLWGGRASTKTEEMRQYLVSLALREYDDAIAMEMPAIVERIAEDAVMAADRAGIDMDADDPREREKFFRFVGTFEDKFFEAIREKIELRDAGKR